MGWEREVDTEGQRHPGFVLFFVERMKACLIWRGD